ncbi:MAG: hypothetical protein H7296_08880 [Bacteroidia bacterium]|nr:hypothetical protein [Bacteroidia bacterium]
MNDPFCIALVFSRNNYRYQSYACQYAGSLLAMQKQVVIFSPDWINLNNYLLTHFKNKAKFIKCYPLDECVTDTAAISNFALFAKYLQLSRRLKKAERELQTKIECVFFAPVDDWIKPKFGKKTMKWAFAYKWSGLLVNLDSYYKNNLKLNIDPAFSDADYLLGSQNCISVATIDRYKSEAIKSRVYKKVIVMPDISDYTLPDAPLKASRHIKQMAAGRMITGTILLENENPENFLKMAAIADSDTFFFVCAGVIEPSTLSELAKQALDKLLQSGKNNTYFILQSLDERQYINDLVTTFDVCYLNDGNYNLPHPLLSKAAFFNKPVIGSKNDMTGKLLASFKTGIGVNGKVSESLNALNLLRLQMPFEHNFDMGKLNNYAKLQGPEALTEALEELLSF